MQITSYCLSHELQVTFIARVTSYFLHTTYELLLIARVTSYFLTISYNNVKDDEAVYDNKAMIKNYSLRSFF